MHESLKKLNLIASPILVMHGKKDKIVPFEMGETIFKNSKKPKYSFFNDYDDHMMDFNEDLVKSISLFVKSLN